MRTDLQEAKRFLSFDEEKFVETFDVLREAWKNQRNVFSTRNTSPHSVLPEGVERGSEEHARYLFFSSIPDIFTESDKLFGDLIRLHKEKPEFFDPLHVYETDRGKLEIREKETKNGKKVVRLVPPTLDTICDEDLALGLHEQISLSHYKTARKIVKWYDGKASNVLKDVTDPDVAYRRLDIGRSKEPILELKNDTSSPRFGGLGKKTGRLLPMWLIDAGIVTGMDETNMYIPIDNHCFNILLGREIIKLDDYVRVQKVTRYAQEAIRDVTRRRGISARDFHYYQWELGHNACTYNDGCSRKNGDGKKLCPFPDVCKYFLDVGKYRKGFIVPVENNIIQH